MSLPPSSRGDPRALKGRPQNGSKPGGNGVVLWLLLLVVVEVVGVERDRVADPGESSREAGHHDAPGLAPILDGASSSLP